MAVTPRGGRGGAGSSRVDAVNVVIRATNTAQKAVEQSAAEFAALSMRAREAGDSVRTVGVAIAGLSASAVTGSLVSVIQLLREVRTLAKSETGKTLIDGVEESAREALGTIRPLSETISALGKGLGGVTAGIGQGSGLISDTVLATADAKIQKFTQRVGSGLRTNIESGLQSIPYENIPIVNIFSERIRKKIPLLVDVADKALASSVVDKLIGSKIPGALKGVASLFGRDLTEEVTGALSGISPQIAPGMSELLGGSALGGLEAGTTAALTTAFRVAVTQSKVVLGSVGELITHPVKVQLEQVFKGLSTKSKASLKAFDFVDTALSGKLSAGVESAFGSIELKLGNKLGEIDAFKEKIAPIEGVKNAILGVGKAMGVLGESDVGKVNELITQAFNIGSQEGFSRVAGSLSKRFIGGLIIGLDEQARSLLPESIQSVLKVIEEAVPEEADAFKAKIAKVLVQGIGAITKPVGERIGKALGIDDSTGDKLAAGLQAAYDKGTSAAIGGYNKINAILSDGKKRLGTLLDLGEGQDAFVVFAKGFKALDQSLDGLVSETFTELRNTAVRSFAGGIGKQLLADILPAFDEIDQYLRDTVERISSIPQKLSSGLGAISGAPGVLAGIGEPMEAFDLIQGAVGGVTNSMVEMGQKLFFLQNSLQALQGIVAGGPFDLLIGQNVRLQEQLLATQAGLAATSKVVVNGSRLADPTVAIQALGPLMRQQIDYIRQGSLELVGVTSGQLVDSFQIIAGQASQIGLSMNQSADLTLSLAAAMGTLGIPLFQARQEITSILTGTIDMNSVLAKSLGITNQQVQAWKSSGQTFEQLSKRLEAFRAGNSLAAQTINGVTSNIQELFEEIGRKAGEQLLKPIVDQLNVVYEYLNKNKDAIVATATATASVVMKGVQSFLDGVGAIFGATEEALGQIPVYLLESFGNVLTSFGQALGTVADVLSPVMNLFSELLGYVRPLTGPFLKLFLTFKSLEVGVASVGKAFGVLSNALPGVGELLFFVTQRSNSVLGTFTSLTKEVGYGAAGFLTFGQNLNSIPGAADQVSKSLGPIGPIAVKAIPALSRVGIAIIGLSKIIPGLGQAIKNLIGLVPGVIRGVSALLASANTLGGALKPLAPDLQRLAGVVDIYVKKMDTASGVNALFAFSSKRVGIALAQQAIGWINLAGGTFILTKAIDEFLLRNESMRQGLEEIGTQIGRVISFLGGVADVILDVLLNPFVMATTAAVGLAAVIRFNLTPSILGLANALLGGQMQQFVEVFSIAKKAVGQLDVAISGFGKRAAPALEQAFGGPEAAKKALVAQLEQQEVLVEKAIAERRKQIEELGRQVEMADPVKAKISGRKPTGDFEQLKKQREETIEEQIKAISAQKDLEAEIVKIGGPKVLLNRLEQQKAIVDEAITERRKQIQELNNQIDQADPVKALADGREPTGNIEQLKKQRDLIADAQLDAMTARQDLESEISKIRKTVGETPPTVFQKAKAAFRQDMGGLGANIANNFRKNFVGALEDIPGTAQKVATRTGEAFASLPSTLQTVQAKSAKAIGKFADSARDKIGTTLETLKGQAGKAFSGIDAETRSFVGTSLLMAAAMASVTLAIGTYAKITEAGRKATDSFRTAVTQNQAALESYSQILGAAAAANRDYAAERLAQIKDEQSVLEKAQDWLIGALKTDPIVQGLGKIVQMLKAVTSLIPGLKGFSDFIPEDLTTSAEAQVGAEIDGFNKMMTQSDKFRADFRAQWGDYVNQEQQLADLRNQQAELRAKGDDAEADALQGKIDLLEDTKTARGEQLDAAIANLEQQKPLNAQQAADLRSQLTLYRAMKDEINAIADIRIEPPDAARLGSVYEQLQVKAESAVAALTPDEATGRLVGETEKLSEQAKILLDITKQQVDQGQITREEAIERYQLIANQSALSAETQIEAQNAIADAQKKQGDRAQQELQRQQQEIEEQVAQGVLSEGEAAAQVSALKEEQLQAQIDDLEAFYEQKRQLVESDRAETLKQIDADIAASRSKLSGGSLSGTDAEAEQAVLDRLLAHRERAVAASNNQIAGLERDRASETQAIETQLAQAQRENRERDQAAYMQDFEEAQQVLEGHLAQGLVSEEDYANKSYELTNMRLDEELALIEEQRALLSEDDKEGQEALAAKEAEIYQRRSQAAQEFQQRQIEIADRARQKMLDAAAQAEVEGQQAIQELVNQGEIRQSEAEFRRLQLTQDRAKQELAVEEEKLKQLEGMDALDDPRAEEERQGQIRQSRLKTHQLSLQLAENEYRRQEMLRKLMMEALEEEVKARENAGQIKINFLEQEQQRLDAISRTYELQQKILQTRQSYLSAASDLLSTQLGILSSTSDNEKDRQKIARFTADIQIQTLQMRQRMEAQVTELNQEQQRIALDREKTENRIAQIRNQAQQARALAELAGTEADPEATPEQRRAAQLNVVASLMEGQALRQQGSELQRQGGVQEQLFDMERNIQAMGFDRDMLQARANQVETLPEGRRRRGARRALARDVRSQMTGTLRQMRNVPEIAAPEVAPQQPLTLAGLEGLSPQTLQGLSGLAQQYGFGVPALTGGQGQAGQKTGTPPGQAQPQLPGGSPQVSPNVPISPQVGAIGFPAQSLIPPLTANASGGGAALQAQSDPELLGLVRSTREMLERVGQISFTQDNQIINQFSAGETENGAAPRRIRQAILDVNHEVLALVQQKQPS